MAKRSINYHKAITIPGQEHPVDMMVQVDLHNHKKIVCSFKDGGKLGKYLKVVIPSTIVDGGDINNLANKTLSYLRPTSITNGTTKSGRPKKIFHCEKVELNITPKQIVEQLKTIRTQVEFKQEEQLMLLLAKNQGWGFTLVHKKWIDEVNQKIGQDPNEYKIDVALIAWDKRKGRHTFAQALPKHNIILFNRLYYLKFEEHEFKEIYLHELAHLKAYSKTASMGHDGSWMNECNQLYKKAFGEEDAKFLFASNLAKYSEYDLKIRQSCPYVDDYWKMKDQQSLYFVGLRHGFKIESKNPLIKKMNTNDIGITPDEYIQNNQQLNLKYHSFEYQNAIKTAENAYSWFPEQHKSSEHEFVQAKKRVH